MLGTITKQVKVRSNHSVQKKEAIAIFTLAIQRVSFIQNALHVPSLCLPSVAAIFIAHDSGDEQGQAKR